MRKIIWQTSWWASLCCSVVSKSIKGVHTVYWVHFTLSFVEWKKSCVCVWLEQHSGTLYPATETKVVRKITHANLCRTHPNNKTGRKTAKLHGMTLIRFQRDTPQAIMSTTDRSWDRAPAGIACPWTAKADMTCQHLRQRRTTSTSLAIHDLDHSETKRNSSPTCVADNNVLEEVRVRHVASTALQPPFHQFSKARDSPVHANGCKESHCLPPTRISLSDLLPPFHKSYTLLVFIRNTQTAS